MIYLNSFKPLCYNALGLAAINKYGFPPFIDSSCRREPDFQISLPSISALCRGRKFAPKLKINDIIVYITVGGKFSPHKNGHHLVAILQVINVFQSHAMGANMYMSMLNLLPKNCMVPNNPPLDFDKTAGNFKFKFQLNHFMSLPAQRQTLIGQGRLKTWDSNYLIRSSRWPVFICTKPLFLNLTNPNLITRTDFLRIFGKIPNTQIPKAISQTQLNQLQNLIGLPS